MQTRLGHGYLNAARTERHLGLHRNRGLELVWVKNGHVTWDYEGQTVHVPAGHLSFSWPWQAHGARDVRLPPVELYWVILPLQHGLKRIRVPRFAPGLRPLSEALQGTRLLERLLCLQRPVVRGQKTMRHAFEQLIQSLHRTKGCPDAAAWGWLILCFSELQRAVAGESIPLNFAVDHRIRQFFDREVLATLGDLWSLDAMAKACGTGRTLFAERVKHIYGDTPIRMLNRKRIEVAQARLQATDEAITQIALDLGYGSSQRFATVFRQYRGCSPTAFRRNTH